MFPHVFCVVGLLIVGFEFDAVDLFGKSLTIGLILRDCWTDQQYQNRVCRLFVRMNLFCFYFCFDFDSLAWRAKLMYVFFFCF